MADITPWINNWIDKEVYLIITKHNLEGSGPALIFGTPDELKTYISTSLQPEFDFDIIVLHGILTRATHLPGDLRDKSAWVFAIDDDNKFMASDESFDNLEDMMSFIEQIINNSYETIEIEDICILYGYEIKVILSIDEDDFDDEIIETCKDIFNEIKVAEAETHGD